MSTPAESAPFRYALAAGAVVAALPVPVLAPGVGGGLAAALLTRSRRRNAGLGTAAGALGGLGYLVGWAALALVLSGAFPPALPDGGSFYGFASFILLLDAVGGAVGGVLGGGLARRARARGAEDRSALEQPE